MAEEKHRMLYQGQDPCQPVLRPLSLRTATATTTTATTPTAEPQQPPTYDDAIGNTSSLRLQNRAQVDRRCTFFAEPQHLRSQQEQPQLPDEQPADGNTDSTVATLSTQLPAPSATEADEQQSVSDVAGGRMPQVRSFFALAPQPKLGVKACSIVCPACGKQGLTRLHRTPNTRTHSWALWLCSFGWCCCACLYPYLMDSCRTTSHYCIACKTFLGSHYPKDCCQ